MLVLSRRLNEEVVFPGLGITVRVIKSKGNQTRLAISAPDSVRILRGELAWDTEPHTEVTSLDVVVNPAA